MSLPCGPTSFPRMPGRWPIPCGPDSYREINNFYTATIYEKGAEIVRMLSTLLGEKKFKAGNTPLSEKA